MRRMSLLRLALFPILILSLPAVSALAARPEKDGHLYALRLIMVLMSGICPILYP